MKKKETILKKYKVFASIVLVRIRNTKTHNTFMKNEIPYLIIAEESYLRVSETLRKNNLEIPEKMKPLQQKRRVLVAENTKTKEINWISIQTNIIEAKFLKMLITKSKTTLTYLKKTWKQLIMNHGGRPLIVCVVMLETWMDGMESLKRGFEN